MSGIIKWGILGTSPISETMAKAIHESQTSELVAVGSRSMEKAEKFANTFQVPTFYDNFADVLANINVDVVYIGLPNHLHKEWIIRAAQAGKHILCEKPFVTNLQDAQEAFAAVKRANVFCMEALMYRCHPFIAKLHALLRKKIIGDVRFINATYTAHIADVANKTEGGSILNLGCYPVSLIRLLAGSASGAYSAEPFDIATLGEINKETNSDQSASIIMRFPKQILATVTTADNVKMQTSFEVYGTEGCLKVLSNPWLPNEKDNRIVIHRNDQSTPQEILVTANKSLYAHQIDVVSQHILDGKTIAEEGGVSWLDTLGNVVVLEAWRKQVREREVRKKETV